LSKEINAIAIEHLKYSRSDVSLWSIKLAMKYEFDIEEFENYSNYLINDRDCLPTMMCYEYSKVRKIKTKKYFDLIKELVNEKSEEEWWIYVYTLYFDKPRKAVFKPIQFKDFYEDMRKGKVVFVNK